MAEHKQASSFFANALAVTLKTALLIVGFTITAQTFAQRPATQTYAITNARLVTVSGAPVERGTIVIRDGLIEAIGAGITAPADARIIDGNGLTVYPGFIDANTTLGIPAPPAPARPAGAQGGIAALLNISTTPGATPASPNSSQPVGLQPELLASDIIQVGGDQIESWRSAGFTSALTAPRTGIFIGQSAVINLNGDTPQSLIVRAPVALHIGFTPLGFGQYPNSLMGVFAALRQSFLDARRYEQNNQIYERNPRGLPRPVQDKSLIALLPYLRGELPVVMNANTEREITRALDLAREFNLKLIIAGGLESYKVADRLRTQNVPVLLSLNFPRRTTATLPEADPEPLRVLRARVQAPKTAAQLAAANIRFAFQSGGMTAVSDFIANAQKSVENGLNRDEALRAMTLRPAEMFSLTDRLGTLETGKIANLTVTRGDVFTKGATIAHVFIDGRQIDLKPATPPATGAPQGIGGTYSLNIKIGQQPDIQIQVTLNQQGEQLSGSLSGALGTSQIANASYTAQTGAINFTAPVNYDNQTTEATFSGTLTGNTMSGTIQIVGRGQGTFTGTRAGTPAPAATPASATPPRPSTGTPPSEAPTTPATNQPEDVPRTNTPPNEQSDRPANQPRPTPPASATPPEKN
ncbi:MAG: amidohydrolase family protein [Pyrinomonadaceae bacterium MAG19_C2-C3]|nr:amidohydrolase family protein [Pyrinomonadaceae bacterium MAG19_C2-C3]